MANLIGGDDEQAPLSMVEAEHIIQGLQQLTIQDVGTEAWHKHHDWVMKLNIQAHENTATHSDEFVMELLVSLDKIKVLVHNLLVIEAWKENVLPHLKRHLAQKVSSTIWYLPLYNECVIANLLEVCLYHEHAVAALPEEHLLELADWCYRKLAHLNSPEARQHAEGVVDAKQLEAMDNEAELSHKQAETGFGAAMCALTILRYLTDNITRMPMGLMSRLVSTNDTIMALLPLLDSPPWVRRTAKGKLEKFMNGAWAAVDPSDRLKVTQADAQVWLALNNLLVEPRCRAKYGYDEWRRDRVLALKRYMNELLFDQLPVLKDLQRTLDEMALGVTPDAGAAKSAALILEAVPVVRDALLRGVADWRALALEQARGQFSEEASRKLMMAQAAQWMQQLELLAGLTEKMSTGGEAVGAQGAASAAPGTSAAGPGPITVSCWRKVAEGSTSVMEAWCDLEMQVDGAKPPEPVALESLHALRYRLLALDPEVTRAVPAAGKVVVKLGGMSAPGGGPLMAQALLQLPEVPVRSAAESQPPIVWVNIGLLAEDGLVLQLKLKRADKPRERDKVAGVWYAYHPVGGALTVLQQPSASASGAHTAAGAAGSKQAHTMPAHGLLSNLGSKGSNLIQTVHAPGSKAKAVQDAGKAKVTAPPPALQQQDSTPAAATQAAVNMLQPAPSGSAQPSQPAAQVEDLDLPD